MTSRYSGKKHSTLVRRGVCRTFVFGTVVAVVIPQTSFAEPDASKQRSGIESEETSINRFSKTGLLSRMETSRSIQDVINENKNYRKYIGNEEIIGGVANLYLYDDADYEIEFDKFRSARSIALYDATITGGGIRYVAPKERIEIEKNFRSTTLGQPQFENYKAKVFPVAVDDKPVIGWTSITNTDDEVHKWSVGADPVSDIPKGLFPAIRKLAIAARLNSREIVGGADVDPLPEEAAKDLNFGNPQSSLAGLDAPVSQELVGKTCSFDTAKNNCFLPAVALHDRAGTICSGTLVSPTWILSASHCFCAHDPTWATIGNELPDRGSWDNSPALQLNFSGRLIHFDSEFCDRMNSAGDDGDAAFSTPDLALVELAEPVSYSSGKIYAQVGNNELLDRISVAKIVSFGSSETNPRGGRKLMVSVSIASKRCDSPSDASMYECLVGKEMVAIDAKGQKDSCFGDSGGGIYARFEDGSIVLVAVVSRGIRRQCGTGGIYVLTTTIEIHKWIKKFVKDLEISDNSMQLAKLFLDENFLTEERESNE